MRPEAVCGLLAEEERLAVFAAVVLGAASPSAVAAATGLPAREVVRALRRLEQGGLIDSTGGTLAADRSVFKDAVREAGPGPADDDPMDPDRAIAAVLRAFVRDGRLIAIPAARGKRRVLLEHIAACFEPGV